ncbi:MAG TPA: DUF2267 domain-containing protein [Polyangiaceae bacterium]|jgi:uncharacterized protein (DUF2267 family)|nr:DUF2267 domain-containing protein [Polyangiaceae bacterium]
MQPSSFLDIVRRVRELAPFPDNSSAIAALSVSVEALGALLTEDERSALSNALPSQIAQLVREAEPAPDPARDWSELIAERLDMPRGRAVERASVVYRALGEVLTPGMRALLARSLPAVGRLLEPAEEYGEPAGHAGLGAPLHDLAEGRAGSEHPLATSDLRRLAHEHSVARSNDPHAETKLSSASGLTQEREARTLSSGQPGSRRSLSSSH